MQKSSKSCKADWCKGFYYSYLLRQSTCYSYLQSAATRTWCSWGRFHNTPDSFEKIFPLNQEEASSPTGKQRDSHCSGTLFGSQGMQRWFVFFLFPPPKCPDTTTGAWVSRVWRTCMFIISSLPRASQQTKLWVSFLKQQSSSTCN